MATDNSGPAASPPAAESHPHVPREFHGQALVVGVVPDQPPLVARTAARLARALGATLYFGYVDRSRVVAEEFPDGSVRSTPLDPDVADGGAHVEQTLRARLDEALDGLDVAWELRMLAGSPERALTHLARAVEASMIVVGTREPGVRPRVREFLDGSVAVQLAHRQHRPVVTVPLAPVDWKARAPWE